MNFILDNWYLFLAVIGSGALLFVPALSKGTLAGLSPNETVQLINREKAVVVDVRSTDDFIQSHIKGAKNVPLEQFEQHLGASVKNKALPLVIVCASGGRAQRAVLSAKKLGYENTQILAGGMKAWKDASLPVVQGKA
ncbi:Rhodanese-related sulfurtransferase [Lampropedia hyalina DSM 16112]|uniref:Rhodanese-related sulfurtransferase n=1 Tax=Lampropedia hyalina DSM 16112 TaxID=1122156 RepID=A0A1M4ZCZ0_9BURK|nr:rhodanese-like domain-containing protein [Lampropedia hyalina]SHF15923.1 Rhodanese-related sulfurtransferase [Lampropedia hyalina DSM 16112]